MQTIDNNFTTNEDDKNLTSQYLKNQEGFLILTGQCLPHFIYLHVT